MIRFFYLLVLYKSVSTEIILFLGPSQLLGMHSHYGFVEGASRGTAGFCTNVNIYFNRCVYRAIVGSCFFCLMMSYLYLRAAFTFLVGSRRMVVVMSTWIDS